MYDMCSLPSKLFLAFVESPLRHKCQVCAVTRSLSSSEGVWNCSREAPPDQEQLLQAAGSLWSPALVRPGGPPAVVTPGDFRSLCVRAAGGALSQRSPRCWKPRAILPATSGAAQ